MRWRGKSPPGSAEGAIARLSRLLDEERAAAEAWGVPGVRERLQAAAPALAALCRGGPVAPAAWLQRSVALHAARLPGPGAPLAAWQQAQRGPRLGAALAAAGSCGSVPFMWGMDLTFHQRCMQGMNFAADGAAVAKDAVVRECMQVTGAGGAGGAFEHQERMDYQKYM